AQLSLHFSVRESGRLVAHLLQLRLKTRADVLRKLVHRRVRIAELGIRGEDLAALARPQFRDGRGPLDPMAQLAESLVEEREDGDRLELALVEPPLHEIEVLIAVEDANVQRAHFFRQAAEDGQVRDDVPAPVLREHDDVERLRKRLERAHRLAVEDDAFLVGLDAVAVASHGFLVRLIAQTRLEPLPGDGHLTLRASSSFASLTGTSPRPFPPTERDEGGSRSAGERLACGGRKRAVAEPPREAAACLHRPLERDGPLAKSRAHRKTPREHEVQCAHVAGDDEVDLEARIVVTDPW